jgi:outer membrane receptor protein involved in Fe transport
MPLVCSRRFAAALRLALALLIAPAFAAQAEEEDEGRVSGHAFNSKSGNPIEGVTVHLIWPDPGDGSAPRQEERTTDADGAFHFDAVPVGTYTVRFTKDEFQAARLASFAVKAGQPNPADVALDPAQPTSSVAGVEEIVVTGQQKAPEANRELADEVINVMGPEDLAKFSASDIADAIKRIPGVNVVEGQFAIIRGLEDRYSSTLYNGAPVPSPDPDRQSVQLDLFPSEVTTNLVVAKTFAPDLPSNSAGGSIDIITHEYPEHFELKLSGGSGFSTNALDRFLRWNRDNPVGDETGGSDVTEGEFGVMLAGTTELAERELRMKAVYNWELDYDTREGYQEGREPSAAQVVNIPAPPHVVQSGDLALGKLSLSSGTFDLTESDRDRQTTAYLDFGFDLDREGNHQLSFSLFYSRKQEEAVQLREGGFLPRFDYGVLAAKAANGEPIDANSDYDGFSTPTAWITRSVRELPSEPLARGPLWLAPLYDTRSFNRDRDLLVYQLDGEHQFASLEGLKLTWAANHAETTQEDGYFASHYFYEPVDGTQAPTDFPTQPGELGPGSYATNSGISFSQNDIDEKQDFVRTDATYDRTLTSWLDLQLSGGLWYENASRDVGADFLETPTVGASVQFGITGDTPLEMGEAISPSLDHSLGQFSGLRTATSDGDREIFAVSFGVKATVGEVVDLLAGVRREDIRIDSTNTPFTGELALDGTPAIFPNKYLFFDRLDNPARGEVAAAPPPGTTFNDQLVGVDTPVDPSTGFVDLVDRAQIEGMVNGRIDEVETLPSAGFTWRIRDGLSLRGAYSQTVARPSFRELGFYVAVESASDDLVVGNPQLQLSNVESWDGRVEYFFGDYGDLVALSAFKKSIENPIESIVIRDPLNLDSGSSALYRTFFNNPNDASLWGVELETKKSFDFVPVDVLHFLSLALNFTWIDATVDRSPYEAPRAAPYFGAAPGDEEEFSELKGSRRLFSQPKWIVNTDLTFDEPDWGTKVTLALFAISDVLDAAGSATLASNGSVVSFALDRYIDSYYQLDLNAQQTISLGRVPGELVLKASAKNLTDTTRRLIYDPAQTKSKVAERAWKVGRDVSLSLQYSYSF